MTPVSIRELVENWRPGTFEPAVRRKAGSSRNSWPSPDTTANPPSGSCGFCPPHLDCRGRPRQYTPNVKAALLAVWEACGRISPKRLAPSLPKSRRSLSTRENLRPETERLLLGMSPATIDRMLRLQRPKPLRRRTTTKPRTLLRHQIRVWTFADWDESKPGFLEVDLMPLLGEPKGEYLHTLTAVDIDTRWCELEILPNCSQQAVQEAIDQIQRNLLFPFLRINSDNDSLLPRYPFSVLRGPQDHVHQVSAVQEE